MAAAAIPAVVGMAIATPAMACAGIDGDQGQHQHAGQVSGTNQHAKSTSVAAQNNHASSVSVLSNGGSGILQANPNKSSSEAGNASDTDQRQSQRQHAWLHQFFN